MEALRYIHDQIEDISFEYSCGARSCGSCGVRVDGKPVLACSTFLDPNETYKVTPLEKFPTERDLTVDLEKAEIVASSLDDIEMIEMESGKDITSEETDKLREGMHKCISCELCFEACPVATTDLFEFTNPDVMVRNFSSMMFDPRKEYNTASVMNMREVWQCLTCLKCEEVCPKDIEVMKIFRQAKGKCFEEAKVPTSLSKVLNNQFELGNPWGRSVRKRGEWAEDLDVEKYQGQDVLLWVGCLGAYEERSKKVSRALANVLNRAEVSWGTLGPNEKCCGNLAYQLGEKMVFEELMEENLETIKMSGAEKIVTISPHCFNVLKNEYFDLDAEVLHYTQYLNNNFDELNPSKDLDWEVTYQDPCYLGRHNEIYEAPRNLLKQVPGIELVEMEKNRDMGVCCGGGGGGFWLNEDPEDHLSNERMEEALGTKADVLATACPFCLANFEDSVKYLNREEDIDVKDISEIVFSCLT